MFDKSTVLFNLESFSEIVAASGFRNICYTDPFHPYLMLYFEKVWAFDEIHLTNLVFHVVISRFLSFCLTQAIGHAAPT